MVAQPSPAARIRELVRVEIEGEKEVSLTELTNAMVDVLGQDESFLLAFARTRLRDAVYEQVRLVVKATRDLVLVGDVAATQAVVDRKASKFADRFLTWFEHAGDRHLRVMEMTAPDLMLAAAERRERGEHEIEIAVLWTQLAERLEPPTQKVSERFTAAEIEDMYQALRKDK